MFQFDVLFSLLGGYLLGSIPFGLLLAHLFGQGDIRQIGSGNIGATNVLRTGRRDLAFATLFLDAAKAGVAALIFTQIFNPIAGLVAGTAALIGHCFPIWLRFKGGKGVATFFGVLLATAWPVGLSAAIVWLVCAALTRLSSLSALVAAILTPVMAYLSGYTSVALMSIVLAIVIFIRHKDNIGRILDGTESRIGSKKTETEPES